MTSILTNTSAMAALQTLRTVNSELEIIEEPRHQRVSAAEDGDELIEDREGDFAAGQDASHDNEPDASRAAKHPAAFGDRLKFHTMSLK